MEMGSKLLFLVICCPGRAGLGGAQEQELNFHGLVWNYCRNLVWNYCPCLGQAVPAKLGSIPHTQGGLDVPAGEG